MSCCKENTITFSDRRFLNLYNVLIKYFPLYLHLYYNKLNSFRVWTNQGIKGLFKSNIKITVSCSRN